MAKQKSKNPSKNDNNEEVRGDSSRGLQEWPEEFKENLVDQSVPEQNQNYEGFLQKTHWCSRAQSGQPW